jgi:hypothetical protein
MTTRILPPTPEVPTEPRLRTELEVHSAVRYLLGMQQSRVPTERRREQRYPFPYPIRLTPVTTDGVVPPAESVVVLGKHLNENGLDFYFKEPLPYRRAIATFERNGREIMNILMELTWCRFGRHGWYENGGRFLQVLPGGGSPPTARRP